MLSIIFLQYEYIYLIIEFVSVDPDYSEDNYKTLYGFNDCEGESVKVQASVIIFFFFFFLLSCLIYS
jgi:hypothetical protein